MLNTPFNRYSYPEIDSLWEEENQLRLWLKVELALCQARAEAGEIPPEAWARIQSNASFGSLGEVKEIEKQTRHDVVAFLRAVEKRLGPDFIYFHYGLTSQDIKDTSLSLILKEAGEKILEELSALQDLLKELALKYKQTPMIGRTHGIQAQPITFGLKLLRYFKAFQRQSDNFRRATEEVAVGKFSGAVGTHYSVSPEIAGHACEILGLRPIYITSQIIPRDIYAFYFLLLSLIATQVEDVATEIRNLQRTEISEVKEPFFSGQMGSSAMPHKRNPVLAEQLCGLSRIVRFNVFASLENVPSWHERDLTQSSAERFIGPTVTVLVAYMLKSLRTILSGLEVDEERMLENIRLSKGLFFSEPLTLFLTKKGLSRSVASTLVQTLSFETQKEEESLQELAMKNETISSFAKPEELADVFRLEHFLKNIDLLFSLEEL